MSKGNAIWLYGSSARGDQDNLSDLDVLLVGQSSPSAVATATRLAGGRTSAISRYSWSEVSSMATYGSLFLHHLRLEGRPLYEDETCAGELRRRLDALGAYTRVSRDISAFKTVLADVRESLSIGDVITHDLAVIATVVRHASILGCWLLGDPQFGRTAPVERYATSRRRTVDGFADLYAYRLYSDNRMTRRDLKPVCPQKWLRRAESLVASLEEIANDQ